MKNHYFGLSRYKFFCILLLQFYLIPNINAQRTKLSLSLKKGQSYYIESSTEQDIKSYITDTAQVIKQNFTIGYTFDVVNVDASEIAEIKVTYSKVSFKQDGSMGVIEYNSDNPPEEIDPLAKAYKMLYNKTFTMKMTAKGSITGIDGIEPMIDSMIVDLELSDEENNGKIIEGIKKQYGEESMISYFENILAIYPEKKVKVGEAWSKKFSVQNPYPMIYDNTWKLKDIKNGIAVIDTKTSIDTISAKTVVEMGEFSIAYKIHGKQNGVIKVDTKTGMITESVTNQNIEGMFIMKRKDIPDKIETPLNIQSMTVIKTKM